MLPLQGPYRKVAFEQKVKSWVDGSLHDPGTLHDDDGIPLVDDAVREYVKATGRVIHPNLLEGMGTVDPSGALTLITILGYLHQGRVPPMEPIPALRTLVEPDMIMGNVGPGPMNRFLGQVMTWAGMGVVESESGTAQTVQAAPPPAAIAQAPATDRQPPADLLRRIASQMSNLYPRKDDVVRVVGDAGIGRSNLDTDGSVLNVWSRVLSLSENVAPLLDRAIDEYPRNAGIVALHGEWRAWDRPAIPGLDLSRVLEPMAFRQAFMQRLLDVYPSSENVRHVLTSLGVPAYEAGEGNLRDRWYKVHTYFETRGMMGELIRFVNQDRPGQFTQVLGGYFDVDAMWGVFDKLPNATQSRLATGACKHEFLTTPGKSYYDYKRAVSEHGSPATLYRSMVVLGVL